MKTVSDSLNYPITLWKAINLWWVCGLIFYFILFFCARRQLETADERGVFFCCCSYLQCVFQIIFSLHYSCRTDLFVHSVKFNSQVAPWSLQEDQPIWSQHQHFQEAGVNCSQGLVSALTLFSTVYLKCNFNRIKWHLSRAIFKAYQTQSKKGYNTATHPASFIAERLYRCFWDVRD